MIRVAIFLTGSALLILAAPVAAQSMQGMDHSSMPGMGKPAAKPKKPVVKSSAPRQEKSPLPDNEMETMKQASPPPAVSECTTEHAQMGHCVLEQSSAKPDPKAMQGMDMATKESGATDPDCPPEHAKMGHCTAKAMPASPTGDADDKSGTDLPPGNAPAPAPPSDWYADRLYPDAEMAASREAMMKENGGQTAAFLSFNLAEYQARKGRDAFRWDGEGWYGGDIDRLTVKSEGAGVFGKGLEEAEIQLLYSRAIDPYFNIQAGLRQDFGSGPNRTYAALGFEGLAPYWFEVEGTAFLSNKGDVLGRLEGYYDQRITQKLILQPRLEANFALQDVPENRIGSGLSDVEIGARLRYEVVKEFAPYIGVEWAKKTGDTARFARAAGEDADVTSFVAGVRFWF